MGNTWIATKGGLVKYDDLNWTVYDATNSILPENDIKAIVVDSQDNVYIGTNKEGLAVFDGTNWTIFTAENSDLPSDLITDLLLDAEENLWISTQGKGIAKFDGTNWISYNSTNSTLTDDYVYSLTQQTDGTIWAGTYNTLVKSNETSWDVLNVGAGFYCFDLAVNAAGIAFAASPEGLRVVNWPNITLFTADNSSLPSTTADAVTIGPDQSVWIGTFGGGLARFVDAAFTVFNTTNSGVPHNDVDALAFDASGNLWIGTSGDGMAVYETNITPPPPPHVATLKWTYEASANIEWFDRWEDGFATGDLNDDGIADVVLGTAAGDAIAVNGESGIALWSYAVPNTKTSVNVDIVDVDVDGTLDIVAGGKASSGNTTIVALNKDGSLKWQTNGDYQETTDLAYGDVNHDGAPDVAVAIGTYPTGGGQVILLDGRDGTRIWDVNLGSGIAFGIDAKDMNGDGDMEVAVTNYNNKLFLIDGATNSVLWSQGGTYYGRDVIIENIGDNNAYEVFAVMGNVYCNNGAGTLNWTNSSGIGENLMVFDHGSGSLLVANPWTGHSSLINGFSGDIIWTRQEAGLVDFGDLDGNGADDIVGISTKYYDPPFPMQYMRAVDCDNNLLWEYQLAAEPSAIVVANIDFDFNDEILVAIGQNLHAFDVVPATYVNSRQALSIPQQFTLYQNYPNPFNPTTTIAFDIAHSARLALHIINLRGRQVRMLFDGKVSPGNHTLFWDGCDDLGHILPSGIYFYSLVGEEFSQTRKMLLVR